VEEVCVDWRIILKLSTEAEYELMYWILDLDFRFIVVKCIFIHFSFYHQYPILYCIWCIEKYTDKSIRVIDVYVKLFFLHSVYRVSCCLHADQTLSKFPAPSKRLSRYCLHFTLSAAYLPTLNGGSAFLQKVAIFFMARQPYMGLGLLVS
jgi:hypothetical protein